MKLIYPPLMLCLLLSACTQSSEFQQASFLPVWNFERKIDAAETRNIVFRSADGGRTWQDISAGLPGRGPDGISGDEFYATDRGLYFKLEDELFHSPANASVRFWNKEVLPKATSTCDPGKPAMASNSYWGISLLLRDGQRIWSPMFDHSQEPRIRAVFETEGGTIFISLANGIYKSGDRGKSWKHVYKDGWAGHLAEAGDVLVATSRRSIIRSADNGETWSMAMSEDNTAWDVKAIKEGFAAITSDSESGTRRISTSIDGGKTWQSAHATNYDKADLASIKQHWDNRPRTPAFTTAIMQMGDIFFSTHPDGIFRSTDHGKTWQLLLPSVNGKLFNISVSGKVVYAIPTKGGC